MNYVALTEALNGNCTCLFSLVQQRAINNRMFQEGMTMDVKYIKRKELDTYVPQTGKQQPAKAQKRKHVSFIYII